MTKTSKDRKPFEPSLTWRGRTWQWEIGWAFRGWKNTGFHKDYYDGWHQSIWLGPLYVYWGQP